MIIVRRLTGQPFSINPDLIERIECTPDTILVLMDGTKYIVNESMEQVVSMVQEHRARIIARALHQPLEDPETPQYLHAAPEVSADHDSVIVALPQRSREH